MNGKLLRRILAMITVIAMILPGFAWAQEEETPVPTVQATPAVTEEPVEEPTKEPIAEPANQPAEEPTG